MSKRPSRFGLKASAVALALVLSQPMSSMAAGLGKLTVMSGLGEALKAEVELNATKEEMSTLTARLAPQSAFKAAGIDFPPVLRGLKVSVGAGEGGKPVLKLSTDYTVSDPFVDLLLELNWAAGRLVREFTFLLDPPDEVSNRSAVAPVVPPKAGAAALPEVKAPAAKSAEAVDTQAEPAYKSAKAKSGAKPVARVKDAKDAPEPKETKPAKETREAKSGTTHQVKAGETLARIAEEYRPEGVSLDQMLVAMLRSSPEAFDGGNMNRLKAGKILQIPDAEGAGSTPKDEARKQVLAQTTDFNAFRRKLAGQVEAAPAAREETAKQGAGGKIAAKVEEKLPAAADKGDRLKVSRTESAKDGGSSAPGKAGGVSDEQMVAKDKALKEANSRLVEVEKTVKDLQQLVEMKNQALADLQKQSAKGGAPAQPAPAAPAVPPAPNAAAVPPAPVPGATPPAAPAPVVAPPAPPKPSPAPKKPVEPPPPPPSFMETLLGNPATLAGGGGILALLLGYAGFKVWQRRKQKEQFVYEHSIGPLTVTAAGGTPSIFGNAGGRSVDTSASAIHTDFSQSGLSAIDTDEGVDPVAEADVYMAYGRDAQAEEILLDALKSEPDRPAIRLKLLEIYAQRKNMLQFESVAGELYAGTGGAGPEWEKAATLGRKLDPHNPLYSRGAKEGAAAAVPDAEGPHTQPASAMDALDSGTQQGLAMDGQAPAAGLDFDLGLAFPSGTVNTDAQGDADGDFSSTLVLGGPQSGFSMNSTGDNTEFNLDLEKELADLEMPEADETEELLVGDASPSSSDDEGSLDLALTAVKGLRSLEETEPDMAVMDLERTEVGNSFLDFELGDASPEPAPAVPMIDLSDISLDLAAEEDAADLIELDDGLDFVTEPISAVPALELPPAAPEPKPEPAMELTLDRLPEMNDDPFAALDLPPLEMGTPASVPTFPDLELPAAPLPEISAATSSSQPRSAVPEFSAELPSELASFTPGAALTAGPTPAASADEGIDPAVIEETETKLELAQAYEEMGDREGARELLNEVLNEGSGAQKDRARTMLSSLG